HPFEMSELLEAATKTVAYSAHSKGLELVVDVEPGVGEHLMADSTRLRQVLINLLGNAIKFTTEGEIVLKVEVETESSAGQVLHFSVRDTGVGIPDDKLGTIFEAFNQADVSTTRKYGGTGLGLSISGRLVELMGGRLWVESQVDKGSVFHFTARCANMEGPPAEDYSVLEGVRVLLAEDNRTNREVLMRLLGQWKMLPTSVTDGEAALIRLKKGRSEETPFGLVLTDDQMPDLDGPGLAAALAKEPQSKVPVVMMVSSTRIEDNVGVAGWISKPVNPVSLRKLLARQFGAEKTSDAAATTPEAEKQDSLKILLAEDHEINQTVALAVLGRLGHEVTLAQDGLEALEHFRNGKFDVILMDVQMPNMDGLQATAAIRELEEGESRSRTPIVAMTAHAVAGYRQRCLDAGMDNYVTKPINRQEIISVLGQLQPSQEPEPAAEQEKPDLDLSNLLDLVGSQEAVRKVARKALTDCAAHLVSVDLALNRSDTGRLQRAAHSLKGTFALLGAQRMAETAERLFSCGVSEELDQARLAADELKKQWARVLPTLQSASDEAS
ncbi:MAG: response regulator, partial [Candidatus Eremiobacteraeota bacterium]|nr:response regulator [Candidatus Eremiobacteraeota bacterium]